ncbi:tyrosine-type recombinase/integrase [Acinetobacter guillouiae]|uniref:tyrosine-type recombinase/integrase n=1 Tax=Acinetobacter guillouiae TaxID=106649 RepID=UPI003AF586CE
MGSIRQRSLTDGTIRYRAEIRINRKDYPAFIESKTFNSRRIAEKWIEDREKAIKLNPDILNGHSDLINMNLGNAIKKYLEEVKGVYSISKINTLKQIQKFPIAKVSISNLRSIDISNHVNLRKNGSVRIHLTTVAPSTIQNELMQIRSILTHAMIMWDMQININEFDKVTAQLRKTRQIASSKKRDRLPTNEELKTLLTFFYNKWLNQKYTRYPMHLIILFAIFSCRRESEITRLQLSDHNKELSTWLVRNLKNPKGSVGNHKEFEIFEPVKVLISIFMRPDIRARMLKCGFSDELLIPLRAQTIASEFTNACKILGIEDLTFHDFRHEGCTRLAEAGLTIPQIQRVSLHDSWQTLQRYVSVKKRIEPLEFNELLAIIDEG